MVTFAAYATSGHEITAVAVFPALALFNVLRFPLAMLPNVIIGLAEARVSLKRLQDYLFLEEVDPAAVQNSLLESKDTALKVSDGEFFWREDEFIALPPVLHSINMTIPRGGLVAVVGPVGCGKSSLLSAFLGEISKSKGSVEVGGSLAYVAQQPWIQNCSLRDNVLFGSDFDPVRYSACLEACDLVKDIEVLPDGDNTEIGEKGINLSGGQKQRVAMARSLYANADCYLFDDPLSAVDAHVGKHIFNNCILGCLSKKTRLLATHQLQFLPYVDKVFVIKDETIAESGTYHELMDSGLDFASLIESTTGSITREEMSVLRSECPNLSSNVTKKDLHSFESATAVHGDGKDSKHLTGETFQTETTSGSTPIGSNKQLYPSGVGASLVTDDSSGNARKLTEEVKLKGAVKRQVYYRYVAAIGGFVLVSGILVMYLFDTGSKISSDWWLSLWSHKKFGDRSLSFYLGIYVMFGFLNTLFRFLHDLVRSFAGINCATTLHQQMLSAIFRSPMQFFETTPIGRILNRFTKDQNNIDIMLPRSIGMLLNTMFGLLSIVIVICTVTPFFLVAILPIAFLYMFIRRYFVSSSRELTRLDSITKSPIFAQFSEALQGVVTIRSFAAQTRFIDKNYLFIDENLRAYFLNIVANRWLGTRLEFMGTCVVSLAVILAVMQRGNIDAGAAGLSIAYALGTTGSLNWLVRTSSDVETQFVSVERVVEYSDLPPEAPPVNPHKRPPIDWPHDGKIALEKLSLRYRADLDLVIRDVSCVIEPQEKIGVCGRTGAGKSSLMLALFRLLEPAEGRLIIDDIDISTIGLFDLRSRLSIIPQDPVLFMGSVRSNLDPYAEHGDAELFQALDNVHLKEFVQSLPNGLENEILEGGQNLSVGQRQLICLARALLRNSKILVMDEATAAIDYETDSLIQATIRKEFKDVTVLTIAHRINTIMDYDRIMVLDAGKIVEFAPPQDLQSNPESIFAKMTAVSKQQL